MAEFRVTGVGRAPDSITHVGITRLSGDGWCSSKDEIVDAIERHQHTFYTLVDGQRAEVAIVQGAIARYLRTRVGNRWTDDLLRLPQRTDCVPDPAGLTIHS